MKAFEHAIITIPDIYAIYWFYSDFIGKVINFIKNYGNCIEIPLFLEKLAEVV